MADGGDGIQAQAARGHGRRCVIWVPPESAPPSRLLTGLSRRHVPATILADAPSVMFDLSLPGSVGRTALHAAVLALIVVEPARQPHLQELLTAVRTYYPQLRVWQYRAGPTSAGGGLAPLADAPAEPGPHNPTPDAAAESGTSRGRPESAATARTAAGDEEDDEASDRRALRLLNDEPHEPMLSAEELEMLLGPMPHQEPPRT